MSGSAAPTTVNRMARTDAPHDDDGATSALTAALVDDAAVFPPGLAPLPAALSAHGSALRETWGALVGPLLVPASSVEELLGLLHDAGDPLDPVDVVLVADTGVPGLAAARNLLLDLDAVDLVGVEVALPGDLAPAEAAAGVLDSLATTVPAAIEVPLVPGWQEALDVLAADGAERAKFRCGGPSAASIPEPGDLAAAILACLERDLPFKLTAGLHRAVRGQDTTEGRPHHGFGNVLAAVAAGLRGADAAGVTDVLRETSPDAVGALLAGIDGPAAVAVRRRFTSFGSCSLTGPRDDLRTLGVLADGGA